MPMPDSDLKVSEFVCKSSGMNRDLGHPWEEETARFDRKLNSLVPLIDELVNNVQRLNVEFEKVKTDLENLTKKTEEQHKRQKQMSVTLVKLDTDIAGLELSKQTFPNVGNAAADDRADTKLDTTDLTGLHGASMSVCLENLAELGGRVEKQDERITTELGILRKMVEGLTVEIHGEPVIETEAIGVHEGGNSGVRERLNPSVESRGNEESFVPPTIVTPPVVTGDLEETRLRPNAPSLLATMIRRFTSGDLEETRLNPTAANSPPRSPPPPSAGWDLVND